MRKVLSERNWVVILFITALTVFSFAQEDAKEAERLNQHNSTASSLLPDLKQTSGISDPVHKSENDDRKAK